MADMWVVVPQGQRQTTELAPNGTGFVSVWEITYRVTSGPAAGTVGTFRIPADLYTADAVRDGIDAAVAALHDVASL